MKLTTWSGSVIDVRWNPGNCDYGPSIILRWAEGWIRYALTGFRAKGGYFDRERVP